MWIVFINLLVPYLSREKKAFALMTLWYRKSPTHVLQVWSWMIPDIVDNHSFLQPLCVCFFSPVIIKLFRKVEIFYCNLKISYWVKISKILAFGLLSTIKSRASAKFRYLLESTLDLWKEMQHLKMNDRDLNLYLCMLH